MYACLWLLQPCIEDFSQVISTQRSLNTQCIKTSIHRATKHIIMHINPHISNDLMSHYMHEYSPSQEDSPVETTEAHKASASSHEGACPAFCLCSLVSRALCFRAICAQGANNAILPRKTPTFFALNPHFKAEKHWKAGECIVEADWHRLGSPKAEPCCIAWLKTQRIRPSAGGDQSVQSNDNLKCDDVTAERRVQTRRKGYKWVHSRGLASRLD